MNDFEKLVKEYHKISADTFNYEKFNEYAITYHSTALEGSTLSHVETEVLLEKNLTPKGKPIDHSLMVLDHQQALKHTLNLADQKKELVLQDIQDISSLILKNTKGIVNCAAGSFDPSQGDFRLNKVYAGSLNFPGPEKVKGLMENFLKEFNQSNQKVQTTDDIYKLSFSAHYQNYNIHPFADGNSRLSRLLMNYTQRYHNMPLSVVDISSRANYKQSLVDSRKVKSIAPFLKFMKLETTQFFSAQLAILTKTFKLGKGHDGISFIF